MHNKIETELETNIRYIESRFEGCADAVMRRILVGDEKLGMYVVYMDSMYDRDFIDGVVLKSLLFDRIQLPDQNAGQVIFNKYLATADVKETNRMEMLIDEVLKGNTAILIDGMAKAMIVSSKNLPGRGVSEAETEVSVRGSKESFTESFRVNTVLIRRRIRDTRLKSRQMTIGVRSKTDVALMYMEDLVRPEMLKQVIRKLESFKIDAILDSSYLESLTEEKWYSPFPQYQSTERPDKAASALLEGRIVLVVDNSPMVLLLPTVFACFFQASDDYYDRWDAANFVRILRYAAAFFAVLLPGMYIALAGFHPEALPLSFALSFAASREGVPFTLPVEVVVMELAFELLREAGIRLPSQLGNTIGVVGGLIVGQAAVEAGIVSTIVVIVVALTAIASFAIPNEAFASVFRLLKFLTILAAAFFGLYGFLLVMLLLIYHLAGLNSFGVPYMAPVVTCGYAEDGMEDFVLRKPIKKFVFRPAWANHRERRRLRKK